TRRGPARESRTAPETRRLASTGGSTDSLLAADPMRLAEIFSTFACVVLPQGANHPPNAPTVTEPATDGLTLSPADVHMETAPFSDPDPGDHALCTDWEIWTVTPSERVWHADCATGTGLVHVHLGDGVFENSHAGRSDLMPSTSFVLRVRDA